MPKQKFEATEGLLEDVMTKQAGSVQKAVLEAVMNSVDANASYVEVVITKGYIIIKDDGDGMDVIDIDRFFRQFGLKAEDVEEKDFGKFRMGRGQIFNFGRNIWKSQDNVMVVDLENDETKIEHAEHSGPKVIDGEEQAEITYEDDEYSYLESSGLSYNLLDRTREVDGCNIFVDLTEPLEDVDETVEKVKKLIEFIPWLHDVKVEVNDEEVHNNPEVDVETDEAYFVFEPENAISVKRFSSQTSIYNQGAFVKKESLGEIKGLIISKVDLDVNFARNDILDNDDTWREIKGEYLQASEQYLLEKDSLSQQQKLWLLERAQDSMALYNKIKHKPLLEDVQNNNWSLEQLQDEKVSFSHTGNKMAADMMDKTGTVILKDIFAGKINELVENATFISYKEVVEDENTFEMSKVDDVDLSKRRGERLGMARWLLAEVGFPGDVEAGFSKHANVWKDDNKTVYIHKGILNSNKEEFLTNGLHEIVEVAAHDGDTREGRDHGITFRRRFWGYMEEFPEAYKQLRKGTADYSLYVPDN